MDDLVYDVLFCHVWTTMQLMYYYVIISYYDNVSISPESINLHFYAFGLIAIEENPVEIH